ncbi:hypothetical protein [Neobacillus niacini]|uniref:hypothetical protein n=1 Tax=Neobacillus niacini TaxID=86668 RepID=UPI00203D3C85|nr:hypothetical protein [Neobacillus niacini]MCM3691448.1 hypothetical protein [Neobacillus niacini]
MQQTITREILFDYQFYAPGLVVKVEDNPNELVLTNEENVFHYYYDRYSTLILDLGNRLEPGVIDIHQMKNGFKWKDESIVSTAKLIYTFPEMLDYLSDTIEKVTIIVHTYPDFDCFASVYLAQYYLQHRKLPPFAKELADYAEEIDTGKMKLDPDRPLAPYSISQVIDETVPRGHINILMRGLELIKYIMNRLSLLSERERTLKSPVLFEVDHPFQMEQILVEEDYKKYLDDLENICEKRKIRLPCFEGSTREVEGLFWNAPSTSLLDKLWARSDVNAPSGKGYTFTFIPKKRYPPKQEFLESFVLGGEEVIAAISATNRVIISVDGTSDVSLYGLAEMLEFEETKKEDTLFNEELKDKWRSRKSKRFPEAWLDNEDPWFDGRNNNYQIVDGPRVGSLLTISEIRRTVLDYTKPVVKGFHTKILYPFQFGINEFEEFYRKLDENMHLTKVDYGNEGFQTNYFLPYIQKYLFNQQIGEDRYSGSFASNEQFSLLLHFENEVISSCEKVEIEMVHNRDNVIVNISNPTIHIFRYGIGFLAVDADVPESHQDLIFLDMVLEMNKELCKGLKTKELLFKETRKYFSGFLHTLNRSHPGIMYSDVTISANRYFESAKKELLFKLSSHLTWNSAHQSDDELTVQNRISYEVNKDITIGISKKGNVLLIFDKTEDRMEVNKFEELKTAMEEERQIFRTVDYYIFLLSLQQRFVLLNFSEKLSEIGVKDKREQVLNLRDQLYDFLVQGWSSQITDDEEGMNVYKKCLEVFESKDLHDEVIDQISAIADYQNTKKDYIFNFRFTMISILFLAITGVTGVYGMNIGGFDENTPIWPAVVIFFGSFPVLWSIWRLIPPMTEASKKGKTYGNNKIKDWIRRLSKTVL